MLGETSTTQSVVEKLVEVARRGHYQGHRAAKVAVLAAALSVADDVMATLEVIQQYPGNIQGVVSYEVGASTSIGTS